MGVYDPNTDGRVQARLTWHRRPCTRCVLMEGGERCLQENPVSGGVLMGVCCESDENRRFICLFFPSKGNLCGRLLPRGGSVYIFRGFLAEREGKKKESFMVLFYLEG